MLESAVVYSGLGLALFGSMARSPVLAGTGLLLALIGIVAPARQRRSQRGASLLDDVVPVFEFHERHALRIRASAAAIMQATRSVSADEIALLRGLMWLRSLGRSRLLGPQGSQPVLEAMQRSGFLRLAEDERELVFGAVGKFWSTGILILPTAAAFLEFGAHGYAKGVTNFRVFEEDAGWCRLTTETRVQGTDAAARRRFAAYWRVIYPGSALIRRMWLRAIAKRCPQHEGPVRS